MSIKRRTYISYNKLKEGDILTSLKFAYAADRKVTTDRFADVGVLVRSESDLDALAELSNSGADKMGMLKVNNTKPIYFSVREVLGKINVRHSELKNSNIKII